MKKWTHLTLATALAAGLFGGPAAAQSTATGTLAVSALVISSCIVAPSALVFASYSLQQVDAEGTIGVTCTADVTSYSVALGTGTGSGATVATRKMTAAGGKTLAYGLYRDSGRTSVWGDVGGTDTVASSAGTGATQAKTFTVYGRIPADQSSAAGSGAGLAYTDTVQITVTY
jgi:spore coat protein U-like protein